MLVRWGIEKAGEIGLPCYLQASEQGRRLYEWHGFQVLGTVEFDLEGLGMEGGGVERMTEMVRYVDNGVGGEEGRVADVSEDVEEVVG
jgi:hypothetical protein